jgi:AraC-like DNA-binding protein
VYLSFEKRQNHILTEGDLILFPPGIRVTGRTDEQTKAVILRVKNDVPLCDKYTLEYLYKGRDTSKLRHTHLKANPIVKAHMELLAQNIDNGLLCVRYMENNMHDLFFYLRAYYDDDELAGFNLPLLGSNATFMSFIWSNYRKVHNVIEFAKLANSSLTAFKVKFKKVTGRPPSKWLAEQKARNIYHEITCGQKTFKEISHEYHFSSVSHLGTFCRKNFGSSPGNLKPGVKNTV